MDLIQIVVLLSRNRIHTVGRECLRTDGVPC